MGPSDRPGLPPSDPDGDGVRVVRKPRAARRWALPAAAVTVLAFAGFMGWRLWLTPAPGPAASLRTVAVTEPAEASAPAGGPPAAAPIAEPGVDELPSQDPNDLASYFRPGDPEPTGAEVIGALHDVGIRTGLGAFNPPGTSPPLEGLAVPEDYPLPEGYVRHHQYTDEGVAIEPILMFAPDFMLHDAEGRPIPLPENRVVPPELAPPDLPVRRVRIPPAG